MSKGGSQTSTTTLDPQTQQYVDQQRRAALGYAGIPGTPSQPVPDWFHKFGITSPGGAGYQPIAPQLPQGITDAQNQFQQYAQGGNLGFSALTGNADAAAQFQNPFTQLMNPFFAQQRAQAVQGANDLSTQMGAFGGDRSGIAAAQAGNLADQNQAGFQYQGFNDAMQRAFQAANLGYGASARSAFLPQQYYGGQLGLLNQGMGPYGQTQTQKTQGDPFSQLLGLGSLFLPGGGLAGLLGGGAGGALPMVI